MADRLDWEKARREEIARKRGTTRAGREGKGKQYPRPQEPSKDVIRAESKKVRSAAKWGGKVSPPDEHVEVKGRKYRVASLDRFRSIRNVALKKSRETDQLQNKGWANAPRRPKKRRTG
jgi:hypothetical protein